MRKTEGQGQAAEPPIGAPIDLERIQSQLLRNSEAILQQLHDGEGEVYGVHNTECNAIYEGNDFLMSKSHTMSTYGIRTIVDGCLGFITSNSDDEGQLRQVAQEAQKLAQLSLPSEHHQMTQLPERGSHKNYDESLSQLTPEGVCHYLQRVVDEACQSEKVTLDRAEMSCGTQVVSLLNSHGVFQQAVGTMGSWFAMGMGKTKGETSSFDYDGGSSWRTHGLEEGISHTMGRFRESILGSLGVCPIKKSYRGPVLFHPVAALSLFERILQFNANGKNHLDGVSPWKSQKGKRVGSKILQVADNPLDRERPQGWRPFDREGIPTAPCEMIQDGCLNFIAYDCSSAHKANVKPTGHTSGGPTSLPQISFSNITISGAQEQTVSEETLYKQLGSGLVIKRFSGNCDPLSGHFSGVAKNSWWVEGGKLQHPVQEVMISGNVFAALKDIMAIGTPLYTLLEGSQAPYILIDGMSVTTS